MKTNIFKFLCFGLLAATSMAMAADPAANPPPEYPVYKASAPIVIDGQFDDPARQDAAPSPVFADIGDGSPARSPVQARILWDDQCFAPKAKTAHLPKAEFAWRAMWARHKDILTLESISNMVAALEKMHVNAVIAASSAGAGTVCYDSEFYPRPKGVNIDPLGELIRAAKAKNIQVYAWTVNLRAMDKQYIRQHPELAQKIQPWEEQSIKMPRVTPDRANAHSGDWLCPDRGLDPEEARFLTELVSRYDLDGIGLDYLGYRNYYACFCDYSRAERLKFAEAHPAMDAREVLTHYSESRLVEWTRQTRELLLKIKPGLKLAIHIYPDFDLNPLYPAKLHVDYCGQTVAWFYKPFWSYGKIMDLCAAYQAESGRHYASNRFVPFVGVYGGDKLKTPDRLRREIRIAGSAGAPGIMLAFFETFREYPELIDVVMEEFAP